MSERMVNDIFNYIGSFVDSDTNNFVRVWKEYLRIRVRIHLETPLIEKNEDEEE